MVSAILAAAAAIGGVKPPCIYNHLPVAYVGHKGGQLTNLLKKMIEIWHDDFWKSNFWKLRISMKYRIFDNIQFLKFWDLKF